MTYHVFVSEAEKNAHPQASRIPGHIWHNIFDHRLSQLEMALIQTLPSQKTLHEINALSADERVRAWFSIACGYPEIGALQLYTYLNSMTSSLDEQMTCAHILGRSDVLRAVFDQNREAFIAKLTAGGDEYEFFYMLILHQQLPLLQHIFSCAPTQLAPFIRANDYEAFQRASAASHLPTMQFLVDTLRDISSEAEVNTMVSVDDCRSFEYALLQTGDEAIVNYLRPFPPVAAFITAHGFDTNNPLQTHGLFSHTPESAEAPEDADSEHHYGV